MTKVPARMIAIGDSLAGHEGDGPVAHVRRAGLRRIVRLASGAAVTIRPFTAVQLANR